jgi:hypothetical protein
MATTKKKEAPAAKKATKKKAPKPASAAATKSTTSSTEAKTKKFKDYTILTKRSGRFEVIGVNGKNINGMDKAKILVDAKLVKTGLGKAPPAAEPAAESKTEVPPAA